MEIHIGVVEHYFSHLGVAVVKLDDEIRLGDTLLFLGHTSDLLQVVCSLEIEHTKTGQARAGDLVAIKVDEPVRPGDGVFRLVDEASDPQNRAIWKGMGQTLEAIYPTYQAVFSRFLQRNNLAENSLMVLLAAISLDPGTIGAEVLQIRGPYTAAQAWMARLHSVAEKGFLLEPEPGEFRLSRTGRSKVRKLIVDARTAMQQANPLLDEEGKRLVDLLSRLVQTCLFTPPPPDTWCIRLAYQLMPDESPALPFIEQALSCLNGYRDDAHLAAWQPSGLSAPALETLTLIWRGQANSLDRLYDRLASRGFEIHDYQAAIDELRKRGFLEGRKTALRITNVGSEFRQGVEKLTDQYFFAPWACFTKEEKTELSCLLSTLRAGLSSRAQEREN